MGDLKTKIYTSQYPDLYKKHGEIDTLIQVKFIQASIKTVRETPSTWTSFSTACLASSDVAIHD